MLEPQSRTLLLDALKPPPEYRLDFAVGTTFTLDLVAMLVAPLAFALLDRSGPDGKLIADPLALLEALRRNADRFAVFCQAGRICVPKPDRLLLSYLERNVVEVKAPYEGVFHPKVWVMRFVADDKPVFYRFVCASRNLTFDRSWDTALVLDGELVDRKNAYAANHPLGDFLIALPRLAVRQVPSGIKGRIEQLQEEVRKVDFQIPDDFEAYGFWPLGIEGYRASPFKGRIDRMLAVSPFVCPEGLRTLKKSADDGIRLVARLDELEKLKPEALKDIEPVQVFSDEHTEDEASAEVPDGALDGGADPELSGLHAKLYIADRGWNSRLWTGSANATAAALRRNVEFLVELHGKKSVCGIDAFLSEGAGQMGFASFLKAYVPGQPSAEEEAKRKVEETLDAVRLALGTLPLRLRVREEQGGAWRLDLVLAGKPPVLPEGIEVRAWPITCRPDALARPVNWKAEPVVAFAPMTFEALTTFVAFEAALSGQTLVGPIQFALNLPAEGFPEDRAKRLLLKFLDSGEAILRYVQLLLDRPSVAEDGKLPVFGAIGGGNGNWGNGQFTEALLEPLIRVLRQEPSRLDDVARLVADLREAGVKDGQLPAGFDQIWQPIWEARQRLNREKPAS
jgi:hypothetical protein